MAKYRKVETRIWNDAKFRALSADAKLIFFFVMTHPSMTSLGAMRATVAGMDSEIGTLSKGFAKGFAELIGKGLVECDHEASFVSLPNFLKYNGPENPNVVKSWEASLDFLPECKLKLLVVQRAKQCAEGLGENFAKGLTEPFRKGMANPEQEPEQEPEPEQEDPQTPAAGKGSKKKPAQKIALPESLKTPAFGEAWLRWVTYRKEMGKKLTETGAQSQMKTFAAWGPERSVIAIDHTIMKGYQGLVEPDQDRSHDLFKGIREFGSDGDE